MYTYLAYGPLGIFCHFIYILEWKSSSLPTNEIRKLHLKSKGIQSSEFNIEHMFWDVNNNGKVHE